MKKCNSCQQEFSKIKVDTVDGPKECTSTAMRISIDKDDTAYAGIVNDYGKSVFNICYRCLLEAFKVKKLDI